MGEVDATPAGAAADSAPVTETVSPQVVAAEAGDFSAFQEADQAKREGKAPAKIERPKIAARDGKVVTGKDGQPAKGPTAKDSDADARLSQRVKDGIDTATADLRRQLDDLRAENTRLRPVEKKDEPAKATEAERQSAEFKRIAALPNAPKAEQYDTTTEHAAALSAFVVKTQGDERAAHDRDVDQQHARETASIERVKTFHGKINEFKATEAGKDFSAKLSDDVKGLHGYGRLQHDNAARVARGEQPKDATVDHAIGELLYDADAPAQVGLYLSEHPEELVALRACTDPPKLTKAFARLEDKAKAAYVSEEATETQPAADLAHAAEAAVDRSVTKAKPPAPQVGKAGSGKDPWKHALETGDVGMFLELDRAQMAEKRGLTAR